MSDKKMTFGCSTGFLNTLCLIFIVLKLTKTIDWSWWWVLSPILAQVGLGIVVFIVLIAVAGVSVAWPFLRGKN